MYPITVKVNDLTLQACAKRDHPRAAAVEWATLGALPSCVQHLSVGIPREGEPVAAVADVCSGVDFHWKFPEKVSDWIHGIGSWKPFEFQLGAHEANNWAGGPNAPLTLEALQEIHDEIMDAYGVFGDTEEEKS